MDKVIVQMIKKYSLFNVGEVINVSEKIATRWCGEDNPRFKVAVRSSRLGKNIPPRDLPGFDYEETL
jgi:hypothetical protein